MQVAGNTNVAEIAKLHSRLGLVHISNAQTIRQRRVLIPELEAAAVEMETKKTEASSKWHQRMKTNPAERTKLSKKAKTPPLPLVIQEGQPMTSEHGAGSQRLLEWLQHLEVC